MQNWRNEKKKFTGKDKGNRLKMTVCLLLCTAALGNSCFCFFHLYGMNLGEEEHFELELDIQIGEPESLSSENLEADDKAAEKTEKGKAADIAEELQSILQIGKITEKKYLEKEQTLRISMQGMKEIQILAVRVNGTVCGWHWDEGELLPECEQTEEALTEIVFVYKNKK